MGAQSDAKHAPRVVQNPSEKIRRWILGAKSPLTVGPKVWYVQTWEKQPLICHKDGNWGRWTIFRSAAPPIRGSKPIGRLITGPQVPERDGRGIIPAQEMVTSVNGTTQSKLGAPETTHLFWDRP